MMLTAIGLMSGTSLDGVDVALIETDGERGRSLRPVRLPALYRGRARLLRQALTEAVNLPQRDARPGHPAPRPSALVTVAMPRRSPPSPRRTASPARISTSSAFTARPCCTGRPEADRADRRWRRRWRRPIAYPGRCTISAPPTSPPAGRARRSCRSITARWRSRWSARDRSSWSISAASPTSPISTAPIR